MRAKYIFPQVRMVSARFRRNSRNGKKVNFKMIEKFRSPASISVTYETVPKLCR